MQGVRLTYDSHIIPTQTNYSEAHSGNLSVSGMGIKCWALIFQAKKSSTSLCVIITLAHVPFECEMCLTVGRAAVPVSSGLKLKQEARWLPDQNTEPTCEPVVKSEPGTPPPENKREECQERELLPPLITGLCLRVTSQVIICAFICVSAAEHMQFLVSKNGYVLFLSMWLISGIS